MKTRAAGFLLASFLLLAGPLGTTDANAQATNWRVTVLEVTSGGQVLCSNAAVSITIPGAVGTAAGTVCGVTGTLTVEAQRVIFDLTGSYPYDTCVWNITSPIRGSGFISGNAVPATSMTGTAQTRNCRGGNFTNAVTGRFQAERVVAGGGGPGIVGFTGQVQVTRPGAAPVLLTNAMLGQAMPSGTQIAVNANSSLTLRFANGDVALGEKTNATIISPRFFLLVPWIVPQARAFMRIVWRCMPDQPGCLTIATPNSRMTFAPPLLPPFDLRDTAGPKATTTDVAFSVTYSERGGVGSAEVSVESGTVRAEDLTGKGADLTTGQTKTITSSASGARFVNLSREAPVVPDVFTYKSSTGEWQERTWSQYEYAGMFDPGFTLTPVDFNGDGLTDFLGTNATTQKWMVAVNDAWGGFYRSDLSLDADEHFHALNLNGDRLSDLILHSRSTGQFWAGINADLGYHYVWIEGSWRAGFEAYPLKLNTDDAVDVLLFNASTQEWIWGVSDGSARFTYPVSGTWSSGGNVYPGDFDGDGRWDVLLFNASTGAWSMAKNTGSRFTIQRSGTWAAGSSVTIGDLDADGDADVVLYEPTTGRWTLQVSDKATDGTERFRAAASGTWPRGLRVSGADFNTDGKLDVLVYNPDTGAWGKVTNNGNGSFSTEQGSWEPGLTTFAWYDLVQGSLPNEPAEEPCASERELKGPATDTAAEYINFKNHSDDPRKIYKLASDGSRQLVATLESYYQIWRLTSRDQPWVVTDENDVCVAIYVPGEVPAVYRPTIAVLP